MEAKKFLTTERGERIDQPDFQFAVDESQREMLDQLGEAFLAGVAQSFVISGFATTNVGNVVTVTRGDGRAICAYREKGEIHYGALIAGGEAARSVDIGAYTDGTYKVYIRLEYQDSDFANRVFWNPLAVTPTETVRSIPTRRVENWGIAIEVASPGAEWMEVATVAKSGGSSPPTDTRTWMFEGKLSNTYALVDAEWGGGNDRNSDRATYGPSSLYEYLRALGRQIQDIIGGTAQYWKNPQGGNSSGSGARSLTQLNDEKLARNGAQTMIGHIIPGTNKTYDLGTLAAAWREIFAYGLRLKGDDNVEPLIEAIRSGTETWTDVLADVTAATQPWHLYTGPALDGGPTAPSFTVNATMNGSGEWVRFSGDHAYMFYLSRNGLQFYYHAAGSTDTWDHAIGAGDWVRLFQFDVVDGFVFDVDLVASRYTLNTAREGYFSLPGGAGCFGVDVVHSDATFNIQGYDHDPEGSSGGQLTKADDAALSAIWPLNLPQGAVITAAEFTGFFDSNSGEIRAAIVRKTLSSGVRKSLRAGTPYDVLPDGSLPTTNALTIDEDLATRTVDNEAYTYYAWLGCHESDIDDRWIIESLKVTYLIDQL